MKTRLHVSIGLLVGCALLVMVGMFASPTISTAQPIFATNTPRPPDPLAISPDLPLERYALRLWSAPQLIDVLVSLLGKGDNSAVYSDAVRLMQYEMAWRFPNAPQDALTRQRLFTAMLTAPRGVADMRGVARPLALAALMTGQIDDFHIDEVATLNMDGDGLPDVVYHLRYPADDALPALYSDYIIVRENASGTLQLASLPQDVYAAPYRDLLGVDLLGTGDYTGDGLDEVIIRQDFDGANDRLVVYGWRGEGITDLATTPIEFGDVVNLSSGLLQVVRYEVESEKWGCYRSKGVNWVWASNFFRDVADANPAYLQLNTIGCQLVAAQPLYEKPPAEALSAVQEILASHSADEAGYAQAILVIAMLEWLDDQQSSASLRVISLKNTPNLPPSVQRQITLFESAIAQNVSPIFACGELTPNNGICDVDQLIARLLAEKPISRVGDVQIQLEALGLPALSLTTLSQVGRADRLVATFAITGASQWAFAPLNEDTYIPEKLPTITPPVVMQISSIPNTAWTALLVNNDGISALNILDNAIRQNPVLGNLPEVQYFRAFCFDVIGNRPSAVAGYYQLWVANPTSLWGRLAGAHLEAR